MRALAQSLSEYVEQYFRSALTRDSRGPVRPVLVGPPDEALQEMFSLLTAGGQGDWSVAVEGAQRDVTVLLVDVEAVSTGHGLSRPCHWDYAVSIRNSRQLVLVLAARQAWDNRPESLANTTETLGQLLPVSRGTEDALHAHLIQAIAAKIGISEAEARTLARLVRGESSKLEASVRDTLPWELLNNLLEAPPSANARDTACQGVGLPVLGATGRTFQESYEVLGQLGRFISSTGLRDAIEQMKSTTAAQAHGASLALDQLKQHLGARLFSPTVLEVAPSRHYRVHPPIPTWYNVLTVDVLADILTELHQRQPQDRLTVACANALPDARPLPGGPFVVARVVELRASSGSGVPPVGVAFGRKIDRLPTVLLPAFPNDQVRCTDAGPPMHSKPIKYRAEAPNYRAGAIDIVVLESFACGGVAVVRDAERNPVPVYATRANTWSQDLALARGGPTDLRIYHGTRAAEISLTRAGSAPTVLATQPGQSFVSFVVDVENGDTFAIAVTDSTGAVVGSWALQITIREVVDVVDSRLTSLVEEHRLRKKSVVQAPDTLLHRLELACYLPFADSWKPVLGCWGASIPSPLTIPWSGSPVLGDVQPQIDPRPVFNPPSALLASREIVRSLLHADQRCVAEIDLTSAALASPVEEYLRRYLEWLQQEPEGACWLDVLAIHAAEWNAQAGQHVASEEPVVVLLSPLHPLRLGWHVIAQRQLVDSLPHLCPAAGLLSPSQCPDAGVIYLRDGNATRPRALFSIPCEDAHWAVLMNTAFLDRPDVRGMAMQRVAELGLRVQAITGGFTAQQTQGSLQEVSRLLPARATLRIGIVGDAESSSECANGVRQWSEKQHSPDRLDPNGCLQVEVFDSRGSADPSPEELADLSERTGERVRWYRLRSDPDVPRLDLTIIDQLGIRTPEATSGARFSSVAAGCLYRVRVREDFQNARSILESRTATTRLAGSALGDLVARTVCEYESLAARDGGRTHFRFTPNQDAVGSRLQNATFLSVTSSQIDPACIVRGTVGQGGYLWDYELPGVLSGGESPSGYYLVAKPTDAMSAAVERAASVVASPPPSSEGLLEEVSRRGIPILKRLASGGSHSRGELGLLLATRLLQDAFRAAPNPPRLPVWTGECIHLVLPVDPYEELLGRIRRAALPGLSGSQRPDLIVVAIRLPANGAPIAIKVTPVEVKYRATGMSAGDMREALGQAGSLGKLLEALWVQPSQTPLWQTCSAALLAQFLDFGFRIYSAHWLHHHQHDEWAAVHRRVMQDVLEQQAKVTVNVAGRLIVFDGSALSRVADLDGDSRQDTIAVAMDDARALLVGTPSLSTMAATAAGQLDFSFPSCGEIVITATDAGAAVAVPDIRSDGSGLVLANAETSGDSVPGAMPREAAAVGELESGGVEPGSEAGQAQPPQVSRIPSEVRNRVREAFQGFVGNEPAVLRLSNDLLRALIERPPFLAKNYLLTGLPSTGKTELARRISRALGLPFVKLDGRGVTSRDKLFELVNGELRAARISPSQVGQRVGLPLLEYPPLIVFIDEVHLVPRALQEALLTMLEAADRTVVLSDQVALVPRATFLFATTRVSDVDAAFASRCDEIQLREYDEAEVARILRTKAPHNDWPEATYLAIARLGRCVPRIAIQLAEALETSVLVAEESKSLVGHLEDVRLAREIDDKGLTRMDFEYLSILERAGGPVGEQNLLNLMRTVDKGRILNDVEPFLVRLGFVRHGPRGRELTSGGREYLLAQRLGRHGRQ